MLKRQHRGSHQAAPRRWGRACVGAWLLRLAVGVFAAEAQAQAPEAEELKGAVVYQITKFVEWPETQPTNAPLVVGLVGEGPLVAALERLLPLAKPVQGRPLTVQRVPLSLTSLQAGAVHVLVFGDRLTERSMTNLLHAATARGILSVSDREGFCQLGGMVGLRLVERKVQLDVNLEACEAGRVRLSSRLLRQARIVSGAGRGPLPNHKP